MATDGVALQFVCVLRVCRARRQICSDLRPRPPHALAGFDEVVAIPNGTNVRCGSLPLTARVHSKQAVPEVEGAVGLISKVLQDDFEEADARVDDDAGFAQRSTTAWKRHQAFAGPLRDLRDHQRAAVSQLAQNPPAGDVVDDGRSFSTGISRSRRGRGSIRHGEMGSRKR
jgi:hypothetical protein